jgi:hypothetical protein
MVTFAQLVYLLCAATALACAVMLLRGYARSGMRLLLWAGLCFVTLTFNNALLYVDLVILPLTVDLSVLRSLIALAGLGLLLYGLIWEERAS